MAKLKTIKLVEFNKLMKTLNLSAENEEAARLMFVEGVKASEVATRYKKSRPTLSNLEKRVWEKYVEQIAMPNDWVEITLKVPRSKAEELQAQSLKLLQEYLKLSLFDVKP
jgi:predicted DNA-binding protein (UPF0251 family)